MSNLTLKDSRRVIAKHVKRYLKDTNKESFPRDPRDYQLLALKKIQKWLEKTEYRTAYLSLATGLGKTVIFSVLTALCRDLRVLIIVPNKILVVQTIERLTKYVERDIGYVSDMKTVRDPETEEVLAVKGAHHDIVVCTDESFKIYPEKFLRDPPNLIIWDECHWAYSKKAWAAAKKFKQSVLIGFSATPDFLVPDARKNYQPVQLENGQTLYVKPSKMAKTYFGECLLELGTVWGIENGWLAPLQWGQVEFNIDLSSLPTKDTAAGFDYQEDKLVAKLKRHWPAMIKTVCDIYKSNKFDIAAKSAYAVCPRVSMAKQLAKALNEMGIHAACIHGGTSNEKRREILADFDVGNIQFLTSVMVLREGWDAPQAEVCWMLRPTRSRVLYMQNMGRVLRKNGEEKLALVIDPHFEGQSLAPLSTPQLFLKPGEQIWSGKKIVWGKESGDGGKGVHIPQEVLDKVSADLITVNPIEITYVEHFYPTLEEASKAAQRLGVNNREEYNQRYKEDPRLPSTPSKTYRNEWKCWAAFFGKEKVDLYPTLVEATEAARKLGFSSSADYKENCKKDIRLPTNPNAYYDDWIDWGTFLDKEGFYEGMIEASKAAQRLGIKNQREYKKRYKEDPRLPSAPNLVYASVWEGWHSFLGKKPKLYNSLKKASKAAQALGAKTSGEYKEFRFKDPMLPSNPNLTYIKSWKGWRDFLGTKPREFYKTYQEARTVVIKQGFINRSDYKRGCSFDPMLPASPQYVYKKDWKGWRHFLGTD